MKKSFLVLLMVALMVALVFVGCGPSAQAPTTVTRTATATATATATTTATTTATATMTTTAPAPIKLVYDNDSHTSTSITAKNTKWFTDELEKRTNGRLQITHLYNRALTKPGEELTALRTGLSDFCQAPAPYYPTEMFLNGAFNRVVPFGISDMAKFNDIMYKMYYGEAPALQQEFEKLGFKYLFHSNSESFTLESKKPITKLEDLKGLKIGAAGVYEPLRLQAAGATPVALAGPDRVTALQTGMIDASAIPFDVGFVYKFYEFCPYQMDTRWGCTVGSFDLMNMNKFNSLPKDIQDIIVQTGKEAFRHYLVEWQTWRAGIGDVLKAAKVTINPAFSDEDVAKWAGLLGEPVADWVKTAEQKGITNAAATVEKYIALSKESGYKFPKEWKVR